VGIKNVTINEQFFQGHYPGNPIMPGVLILEAMAQVGGISIMSENPEEIGKKVPLFAAIDDARFRRQVVPGDQLRIEVDVLKMRSSLGKVSGKAFVGDELAAEAVLTFFLVDKRAEE
jgi:3-hydroxyacyl-[acyl-carrier-protein] dehydratase